MNNFQKQLNLQLWARFSYIKGGKHAVLLCTSGMINIFCFNLPVLMNIISVFHLQVARA